MNRSITIVPFARYAKVSYYSLQYEDEKENAEGDVESLTDKFFSKYAAIAELSESLEKLKNWIVLIGNEYGALFKLFRHENNAVALPPNEKFMKLHELVVEDHLRLYTYWVNESIVILMDGGLKDFPNKPVQDCPELLAKFRVANKLSKQIRQAFIDKDIIITKGNKLEVSEFLSLTN